MDSNTKTVMETPLVSILMLTYNRSRYIGNAIESILKQSYTNFELIILDDGSTDDTATVVGAYTDPRIRYIQHEKNAGLIVRRQESLALARGSYIAVLDSDDVWTDQTKLETQVAFLEKHPEHVLIGTFITHIDANGKQVGGNQYAVEDTAIRNRLLARNQFTHSSVLMRTSAIAKVSGYRDVTLAEDFDLFLQLGTVGKLANIPKAMTAYRIHAQSFNPQKLAMAKAVLAIVRQHKDAYPNYLFALLKSYLRIVRALFI